MKAQKGKNHNIFMIFIFPILLFIFCVIIGFHCDIIISIIENDIHKNLSFLTRFDITFDSKKFSSLKIQFFLSIIIIIILLLKNKSFYKLNINMSLRTSAHMLNLVEKCVCYSVI